MGESQRCVDLVSAAAQPDQHGTSLVGAGGFAQELSVDGHDGVGTNNENVVRRDGIWFGCSGCVACGHSHGFGEGKAGHQLDGRFVGRGRLIDVSRFGMERDAEKVEELLAAGAVGGKYDFGGVCSHFSKFTGVKMATECDPFSGGGRIR